MGDAVGSIFAGSPSQPDLKVWQPGYTGEADPLYYNTLSKQIASNPFEEYKGASQAILNAQLANPYTQGYQNAAVQAGQGLTNTGNAALANSAALSGTVGQNLAYGNQVAQMGLDPQQALYNRTLQQLQDQVRTSNATRGINTSPYGAGLENQALSNFNIDWQGQALNRALAGLSGYNQALASAGNTATTGSNLGVTGAGTVQQGGYTPYSTYGGMLSDRSNAIGTYGGQQLQGQAQQTNNLAQLLNYLNLGANQSNQQANFDQISYQNAVAQSQRDAAMYGGLISGAAALGAGAFTGGGSAGLLSGGGLTNGLLLNAPRTAGLSSINPSDITWDGGYYGF